MSCCSFQCKGSGVFFFFFSSRRRHTRLVSDWSSDVCSSDLRGHADRPALPVHVHTEPAQPGHRIREIELPVLLKLLLLKGVEHAVGELEGILWRQRRLACRLERSEERRVGKECRSGWLSCH